MRTRPSSRKFILQTVAILFAELIPTTALAQNRPDLPHQYECTRMLKVETEALNHQQWSLLVSTARQYIASCRDLFKRDDEEAPALSEIAIGLNQQGKMDDAIPVSQRCIRIKPDASECYANMGESLEGLGRVPEAIRAYEQAIEIGGYDDVNASAIKFAKGRVADLRLEQSLKAPSLKEPKPPARETKKFGTGFVVSKQGHMLTNDHVVAGCKTLITGDGKPLQVLTRNASSDLALLQGDFAPDSVAVFRAGPSPKLGDAVVAFGFPLPGLLSSDGNVSAGILSATSGLGNDVRFVQISAPVQPGNSGGPLFDASGHVIGVVVAKLDAIRVAEATGDVPQNVNFAVHWSQVRAFLEEAGVPYQKEISRHASSTRNIAEAATHIAFQIECTP